ncbi:hypothetical protein [Dyadobacter bucti]|uniref:hypothetical protein n=1 Tax=Dyadobacter bucti TaxID=2572203 RepID=UPI00110887D2|nr:hypothetical protein [Dyadobacter bucti]
MEDSIVTTGEIIGVDIYLIENEYLSAALKIEINGDVFLFGGRDLFASPATGEVNFFGQFLLRCLQVTGVDKASEMVEKLIKVRLNESYISGICAAHNDYWFYPGQDFVLIEKGTNAANE